MAYAKQTTRMKQTKRSDKERIAMQELKDSDDSVVAYSTAEYKSRIIKLWRAAKVAEKYFYLPFELPCDAANNLPEKLRKPDHYYPQPYVLPNLLFNTTDRGASSGGAFTKL